MSRKLHIVCLDVPWPADYGGAIDMMNRIMAFKRAGVGIHLHYFSYNKRGKPTELNQYCESVNVYERKTGLKGLSLNIPYIVASRDNPELITNLNKDNLPILLEGIHCTGVLPHINYKNRKVVVRMHNEESLYYNELARAEKSLFKKMFFKRESRLISRYNNKLPAECTYACVSIEDVNSLKEKWGLVNSVFIPTFPASQQVKENDGNGKYCLFHGNLSVPENEEAAIWLIKEVFSRVNIPFVIAGKNPARKLLQLAAQFGHVSIIANPVSEKMNELVREAHISLIPSFNKTITGIRLKLLHTLFEGRYCIASEVMVKGTGLEGACHIANSSKEFIDAIQQLFQQPFTKEESANREKLLGDTYNNDKNTSLFSQYLW